MKRDYETRDIKLLDYTTHIPSDDGAIMRRMNPKWSVASNGDSIDGANEHCVSWLCDPAIWEESYKVEGVADFAIGSPSVEMYMKAFNAYAENDTALVNKIGGKYGYSVGANNSYSHDSGTSTAAKTIVPDPNNLFMTWGTNDWWLVSPIHSTSNGCIAIVGGNSAYNGYSGYGDNCCIYPIAAIS